jgi:hypothetical protein
MKQSVVQILVAPPDEIQTLRFNSQVLCNTAASVVYWLACWPLVPKIVGSLPAKKSSACLPSEGK